MICDRGRSFSERMQIRAHGLRCETFFSQTGKDRLEFPVVEIAVKGRKYRVVEGPEVAEEGRNTIRRTV